MCLHINYIYDWLSFQKASMDKEAESNKGNDNHDSEPEIEGTDGNNDPDDMQDDEPVCIQCIFQL